VGRNYTGGLTKAEVEVLRLLSQGKNYSQLAGIYETTIGVMNRRLLKIYHKLGTETKVEALIEAGRRGIVSMAD